MPSDSERNCDRCNCLITGKDYHTINGLFCEDCATGGQLVTPSDRDQQDREAFEKWCTHDRFKAIRQQSWQAALAYERGKSGEDDDQMTDGWLRSIGGVEPDYTEDFTETTFIFDLDNDHCLNVEVDNQRVYIYDAGQEHVAIELPHIKTCGQFLKLLFSGIRPLPSPPATQPQESE